MYLLSNRALLGIYVRFQGGSMFGLKLMFFFLSKIVKVNFWPIFSGRKLSTYSCFQTKSQVVRWSLLFQQYHVNKTKGISLGPNKQTLHTFNSKSHLLEAANQNYHSNKKNTSKTAYVPILLMCMQFTLAFLMNHPGNLKWIIYQNPDIWWAFVNVNLLSTPTIKSIDLFCWRIDQHHFMGQIFPKHESFGCFQK